MTFFDWLSDNPIGFLFLALAFNVFIVFAVVALVQGRTIAFWPPKIGRKIEKPSLRVLVDTVSFPKSGHENFWDGTLLNGRDAEVPVRFKVPFQHKPDVIVSLHMLDAGIYIQKALPEEHGVPVVRVKVEARNVTTEGFVLHFETWKQSLVWNAMASWVAVGN